MITKNQMLFSLIRSSNRMLETFHFLHDTGQTLTPEQRQIEKNLTSINDDLIVILEYHEKDAEKLVNLIQKNGIERYEHNLVNTIAERKIDYICSKVDEILANEKGAKKPSENEKKDALFCCIKAFMAAQSYGERYKNGEVITLKNALIGLERITDDLGEFITIHDVEIRALIEEMAAIEETVTA